MPHLKPVGLSCDEGASEGKEAPLALLNDESLREIAQTPDSVRVEPLSRKIGLDGVHLDF
jgi:hypothetical protein